MFCFWIGGPGIVGSGGLFLMSYEFSFINIFSPFDNASCVSLN